MNALKNDKIILQKAQITDIPAIAALADRIWHKHYSDIISKAQIEYMLDKMYSHESLKDQMVNKNFEFFFVNKNDDRAGFLAVEKVSATHYFLHKFYIAEEHAGKGLGGKIINYLPEKLPLLKSMELAVNRKNFKSINFYFKYGFIIKEIKDTSIGDGFFMNDFIMIKKSFVN